MSSYLTRQTHLITIIPFGIPEGHHFCPSVKKIIVVEDDLDFRDSLVHHFRLQSYEVTGVGSALGLYKTIARESFVADPA